MAIITNVVDERGNIYTQQYVRVERAVTSKDKMDVEVGVHESEDSARAGVPPHRIEMIYRADFDLFSTYNVWEQAYVAIKQRWPDFLEA